MKLQKSKAFRIAAAAAALAVLLAAAGGYYVLRALNIRDNGIPLTPARPLEPATVEYYLQNDPQWAGEKIGGTSQTLGGAGCLISCAAAAITALGVDITPSDLNGKLTELGGYSGADLIWYKLHEAVPEITYKYSRVFSSKTIQRDLERGLLPIVNVRYRGSGISHWLLVIGADGGDFLVLDPLNKDKTPVPLSAHGRVYSYRVLTLSE